MRDNEQAILRPRRKQGGPNGSDRRARYRDYVTFRLDFVSSMARAAADKIYERQCGLSIRQLRVLRCVAENPGASVSEIVGTTMFERTLVSRLISELVNAGFLARRISNADARQFHIDITPEGLAKADVADELGDRLNEDLLSSLDADERAVLDRCLEKLVRWRPSGVDDAASEVAMAPHARNGLAAVAAASASVPRKGRGRDGRQQPVRGGNGNA